ncbi:MAG: SurA N-terminal domain [Candidatus Woesearchaeota archaeon]|nr:SurA N-terminal domain [Candidatus Woesearchaeota archaeon]
MTNDDKKDKKEPKKTDSKKTTSKKREKSNEDSELKQEQEKEELEAKESNEAKSVKKLKKEGKKDKKAKEEIDKSKAEEVETEVKKHKSDKKKSKNHHFFIYLISALIILVVFYASYSSFINRNTLVTVNGEKITIDDVMNTMIRIPYEQFNRSSFEAILDSFVNETVLRQWAEREGIKPNESLVEEFYQQYYVSQFSSEEELKEQLALLGYKPEDIKESIRGQLIQAELINKLFSNITVSDEEIESFYNQNEDSLKFIYAIFMNKSVSNLSDIEDELAQTLLEIKLDEAFVQRFSKELNESNIKYNEKTIDELYELLNEILAPVDLNITNITNVTNDETNETNDSIEENQSEEIQPSRLSEEAKECILNKGYNENDVLVFLSKDSEDFDKIIELEETLSMNFVNIDIASESFFNLSKCLDVTYIPSFLCVNDMAFVEGYASGSVLEEAMKACI